MLMQNFRQKSIRNTKENQDKIIWLEDGFCFSAIVSEEIFENFKNGTELVKKEIYN